MSELVYAYVKLAPWNPEELKESAEGKTLLKAIDDYFPEYDNSYTDNGYNIIELIDHEAYYGTSEVFNTIKIPDLLAPLDLWCQMGDDGGSEWNPHKTIITPDGVVFDWLVDIDGRPLLNRGLYEILFNAGGNDAIDLYWDITSRSLGEWVDSAPLQPGVSLTQDAVYKVVFAPYGTVNSGSVSVEQTVH